MSLILFNDNIISPHTQRGIARYFGEIVEGAGRLLGEHAAICSPQKYNFGAAHYLQSPRFRGSSRIGLHDHFVTVAALAIRPTVIHNAYYGHVHSRAPQVFTLYDMITEMFAPAGHPLIAQKQRCIKRAAALLAISKHSAQDLFRFYPDVDPAKVHIIPLGVDELFFSSYDVSFSKENRPYFLFVGRRLPYKNFGRLLEAFGQAGLYDNFDLRVISPTDATFSADEQACIERFNMSESVHLLYSPADLELHKMYSGAYAFVYPSLYEGFGLPIVEALASGTLVCTSGVSSMPELGGDVAFYFEPTSVESIAVCLRRVAALGEAERIMFCHRGIERARLFSWDRCVTDTLSVLQNVSA